ncbi:multidrug/biocide efflux PACE transporter [Castellaniella sp.]|uniref:multidrug/biocide efflux PACE transporter n=1 Tax=Castellaniella sp. TaxID=1955812 RepID=UPI002AFE47E9|nr:multidrug/biocide efflux PACE transporter [Castellaniella sp.]
MQIHHRSLSERIFHALAFEVLAIGISAPLAAWITGRSIMDMSILTAVMATIAVLWNMVYNWLFDRLQAHRGFDRTYWVRVGHACGFEGGLILIAIPFVAWWLDISLWHALVLDIGFVLFYLPYGFLFNLGYDKIRQNLVAAH